ncbi:MAG TPA: aldo/keto reductase [Blastocatellia bacterium]|nr:aldo/keto reductase [Blastocatellia bacterium]
MALNSYVTLGNSGLRVSPLCLGAMTFGEDWNWGSSVADSEAIIARFLERGGNFIDTANIYTKGHSEKILGDFIAHDRARRDRIVLATKFFCNMFAGDPNGGGSGRKAMVAQCEQSLRRLQTDYIDLYWLHAWDRFTPIEETMRALDDLVTAGKVRYIGFSDCPAWKVAQAQTIARFRGWAPLVALQIEYSLLERTVEGELIPMAIELGLGVTPWSPLKSGALSGKYTRENADAVKADRGDQVTAALGEKGYAIVDELARIAAELDTTVAAVALAWVQGRPGVTSTIIGARRMEQLDANLDALDVSLSAEQVSALDQLSTPVLPFPIPFLQRALHIAHAGATVNGEASTVLPITPVGDDRY